MEIDTQSMRLWELIPLTPTVNGYHNAYIYMCGGIVLPVPSTVPCIL